MGSTELDFDNRDLTVALDLVRRRIVFNQWLLVWFLCCNYVLAGLALAVLFASSTRGPLLAAGAALAVGAIVVAAWLWRHRPSSYSAAQQLDEKSHSRDRISTAVHFWRAANPSKIALQQRDDAIAHLAKVNVRELFPLQMPAKMWRTWALLGVVCVVCAYHAAFGPPISTLRALKENAAKSQVFSGILVPVSRAISAMRAEKNELLRFVSGAEQHEEAKGSTGVANSPVPVSANGAAQAAAASHSLDMSQAMQVPAPGGGQPGRGSNQATPGQSQNAQTPGQPSASGTQQSSQQSSNGQGSLAQKALQALENLMSGSLGGQQNGQPSANPPPPSAASSTSAQSMSGASQPAPSANQAAQGQTSNSQSAQNSANAGQGKHTGAGDGSAPWQPREGRDPQAAAAEMAQERVVLQANGFRGAPGRERSDVGPGTAQTPLQNIAPQAVATVSGAGQDRVPQRYRTFLKTYFQRGEKQ